MKIYSEFQCEGSSSPLSPLTRQGIDQIKLAINPYRPDGGLKFLSGYAKSILKYCRWWALFSDADGGQSGPKRPDNVSRTGRKRLGPAIALLIVESDRKNKRRHLKPVKSSIAIVQTRLRPKIWIGLFLAFERRGRRKTMMMTTRMKS